MKFSNRLMASLALFLLLGYLPACGQTKAASCDPRLGLAKMEYVGLMKYRWQDAKDPEGELNPSVAREMHKILRFGKNAVPLLIACLADESKTQNSIWDYWPEPKVRDVAFDILCDLFSDAMRKRTLEGAVMWSDVQAESPGQPTRVAWGIYNEKHGTRHVQQVWLTAWEKNKSRIYWDDSANCFKVKVTP
jgi:hypothetical protein